MTWSRDVVLVAVPAAIFSLHSLAMGEETDGQAGAAGRHGGTGVMDGWRLTSRIRSPRPSPTELPRRSSRRPSAVHRCRRRRNGRGRGPVRVDPLGPLGDSRPHPEDGLSRTTSTISRPGPCSTATVVGQRCRRHRGVRPRRAPVHLLRPVPVASSACPSWLVTSRLDGRLTVPYMLAAWLLTALFVVVAAVAGARAHARPGGDGPGRGRRVRRADRHHPWSVGVHGPGLHPRTCSPRTWPGASASPWGASSPCWACWSARRGAGWWRGLLILCANLDRLTTGWACVVGAVWSPAGSGSAAAGQENRRWCVPDVGRGTDPVAGRVLSSTISSSACPSGSP